MLGAEDNARLTAIGPRTPMGSLLRRYWQPIAAKAELDQRPTKALRILGEDLVLYRDQRGTYGLLAQACPHRRASLAFGLVESPGLRCSYHGWRFDEAGTCLEQPFEDTIRPDNSFRERTRATAYPVREKAGLLWAYLGPPPAPCLWDWAPFHLRGFKHLAFAKLPCNWLQCQENSVDPVHFEWLHQNWTARRIGAPYGPTHQQIGFDEFEFGIVYRRLLSSTTASDESWTAGRVCLWPNALFVGHNFSWNVPIDDHHTLRVMWWLHPLPGSRPYHQTTVPYFHAPVADAGGELIVDGGTNQDVVAMISQGTVADRSAERLGESDRGIIMLRKIFLGDLDRVAAGQDPKGVLRDEGRNHQLPLPLSAAELTAPPAVIPPGVFGMTGPSEAIRVELERVWAEHSGDPP